MSNPKPGAASTTSLPPYSGPHHAQLVWVYSALAGQLHAEELIELETILSAKAYRASLIGGIAALQENAREYFRQARNEGNLLLCWHGTKSLEVPA